VVGADVGKAVGESLGKPDGTGVDGVAVDGSTVGTAVDGAGVGEVGSLLG
jgi:hypothetical protein